MLQIVEGTSPQQNCCACIIRSARKGKFKAGRRITYYVSSSYGTLELVINGVSYVSRGQWTNGSDLADTYARTYHHLSRNHRLQSPDCVVTTIQIFLLFLLSSVKRAFKNNSIL